MRLTEFLKLFKEALKEWIQDRADGLAASMAFYQVMSIPPFIALILLSSSVLFGDEVAKAHIEPLIGQFSHPQIIVAVRFMLDYSFHLNDTQFFTIGVIAVLSLIKGTLGFFAQIKDSIETFWNIRREGAGIKFRLDKMLKSLLMATVVFIILLSGLLFNYLTGGISRLHHFSLNTVVEYFVLAMTTYFLLTYCPPMKIHWKEALPGVLITSLLYFIGRLGIKFILKDHQPNESQDVAVALMIYLLWSYYSSLIFLYGAEFSRLYIGKKRGIDVNQLKF